MQIMLGKGERRTTAGKETMALFYEMFNCLCSKAPRSSSGLSELHNLAHAAEEEGLLEILWKGKKDKIIASSRRVETRLSSS